MEFKVPFLLPNGILGTIVIFKPSDKIPFTSLMPLEKRVWTSQESILSPRLLIFGRGEVFWVCRTSKGNLQFKVYLPFILEFHCRRHFTVKLRLSINQMEPTLQETAIFWSKKGSRSGSLWLVIIASDISQWKKTKFLLWSGWLLTSSYPEETSI